MKEIGADSHIAKQHRHISPETREKIKVLVRDFFSRLNEDCEGNPFHDEDGLFSSAETDGSWSLTRQDCDPSRKGQFARKRHKIGKDKTGKCGRFDRSQTCKD